MRNKIMTLGLGLALSMGAAGAAFAQSPAQSPSQEGRRDHAGEARGPGGRRGPGGFLLKGITLSDAQKAKVAELRKSEAGKQDREKFRATFEEARALRQKGDTAGARAKLEPVRQAMQAQRDQQIAQLRGILTADQQKQLDANVAEMKQREAQRPQGGRGFGERGQHGGRRPQGGERQGSK